MVEPKKFSQCCDYAKSLSLPENEPQFMAGTQVLFFSTGTTYPPIKWEPRTLSPGVQQPGCETDQSAASVTEGANVWSCITIPSYIFTV